MITGSNGSMTGDNRVRIHSCFSAYAYIFLNNGIGADRSGFMNCCLRVNHGSGMYGHVYILYWLFNRNDKHYLQTRQLLNKKREQQKILHQEKVASNSASATKTSST
jgi:hypothetical protein